MMDGLDRALTESPAVQGLAMVGLSPASLSDALSFGSMRAAFLQARLSSDLLLFDGGLMYTEKSGLLSLMACGSALPSALCATGGDREFNQLVRYERDARKFGISAEDRKPHDDASMGYLYCEDEIEIGVDLRESIVANFKPES